MVAHLINTVYVVVLIVYAVPVVVSMFADALVQTGVRETIPAWIDDQSWRGFITSPMRMWK